MTASTRSFWAWGYEEQFPDEAARAFLAQAVGALLGAPAIVARPLPRFEEAALPAPRLAVPPRLAAFATTDARERALHTYGKGFCDQLRAFALDFAPAPDFILLPRDEAEIALALAECSAGRIAVIPFGGGTSVVGGVEGDVGAGYRGVASLDLRLQNRVLEVDLTSRAARIQAGASGPAIEAQLAAHGLTLRHYPQSFEFSTLGGWLATRAGGHFATLYTHIDDFVESVRMVTAKAPGILETRRLPASGAGPAPERLLLGSEGVLGVFSEAWLRVQRRPRFRSSASVHFAELEQAVAAVRAVTQAGLYPSNCRLLDASEAMLNGVAGPSGGPVLLLGFESAEHQVAEPLARALAIATAAEYGGACPAGPVHREAGQRGGDGSAESWRQAFFAAPYRQSALLSLGVMADTFETACTWERFPALYAAVREAVLSALREACGTALLTLRFTHVYPDGPAPYFTFLAPLWKGADVATATACWRKAKQAASNAILDSGGTITHHHAVGRTHRPFYERERAPLFGEALAAVKRTLDPAWVLNPGALVQAD